MAILSRTFNLLILLVCQTHFLYPFGDQFKLTPLKEPRAKHLESVPFKYPINSETFKSTPDDLHLAHETKPNIHGNNNICHNASGLESGGILGGGGGNAGQLPPHSGIHGGGPPQHHIPHGMISPGELLKFLLRNEENTPEYE